MVLEIEVQGARQVRAAMRESVQVFIAPPDPASLRRAARVARHRQPEAIDARLEVAEQELEAQDEFPHGVVNDDLERAADELEGIVRAELGTATRLRQPMIKPRVDKLLDHTDSHYAAVIVAAKRARQINSYYHNLSEGSYGEYPPPMVDIPSGATTSRSHSKRSPRASSNTSTAPSAPRRGARETDGQNPGRRKRRHRRLQGARAGAPGDARPATACAC